MARAWSAAAPAPETPPSWRLRLERFSPAARWLAFGRSGTKNPSGPQRPASRSAFGVLQLAYLSRRYGLLPGIGVRGFLSKIVPPGWPRVNAEKELRRLLSAPDRMVLSSLPTQTAEAGERFEIRPAN